MGSAIISCLWVCYVEVCTAVFTDVDSLLKHVWTCELRSKFMDKDSELFVCLECGKCYKGEKWVSVHVQTHQQVWFFCNLFIV